jgi:hypothetical protein
MTPDPPGTSRNQDKPGETNPGYPVPPEGWTHLGTTDGGGHLYIAPTGTPWPGAGDPPASVTFRVADPDRPGEIIGPPDEGDTPPWTAAEECP